jgi:hypothetical protein
MITDVDKGVGDITRDKAGVIMDNIRAEAA